MQGKDYRDNKIQLHNASPFVKKKGMKNINMQITSIIQNVGNCTGCYISYMISKRVHI
jgi:hypothetical protein